MATQKRRPRKSGAGGGTQGGLGQNREPCKKKKPGPGYGRGGGRGGGTGRSK